MPLKDNRYKNNYQGMTLIEVLAALILLSILAVTLVGIFTPTASWIYGARKETTACNYAAAVLEDLRSNRAVLASGVTRQTPSSLSLDETEYKPADCPTMQAYISMSSRTESTAIFDIAVTVEWTEGSQTRSMKLMTIMRTMGVT
jgi:prepilin-type N-terminal cleavage/methylation domain-containing protein